MRPFRGIAVLCLVTAAFTHVNIIRDRQDAGQLVSRVDQARLEKLLAAHDPFGKVCQGCAKRSLSFRGKVDHLSP
ncbi:hypothetical protein SFUMM280S_07218 [Streptomyces fumanus]